tara:strand:+ start:121 stop:663 length:543 start_codon:yes stop_codon:yes gene_type:complete
MTYFQYFPLMAYDIKGTKEFKLLPQIIKRVKLRAGIRSGMFLFDEYDVKDGERPEDIAFKFYGDAGLHWVILMTNDITDRYYGWPMTQPQFQEFIKDKYGLANVDATHHYEISQTSGRTSSSGPNDYSHRVECNSDEDGATAVTNREYEQRLQDKNRAIKLLDQKYLNQFVEEFEQLIQG